MKNFTLPKLPYNLDSLSPFISSETMDLHYNHHHRGYLDQLNKLIHDSPSNEMTLEEIVLSSQGDLFHNAAQVWNHSFFWNGLSPFNHQVALMNVTKKLQPQWNSFESFQEEFSYKALTHFGSGWTWLVMNEMKEMEIICCHDAETPLKLILTPLMVLDVWEHAYYLDYKNERKKYIQAFWKNINWDFVSNLTPNKR